MQEDSICPWHLTYGTTMALSQHSTLSVFTMYSFLHYPCMLGTMVNIIYYNVAYSVIISYFVVFLIILIAKHHTFVKFHRYDSTW